MLLFVCSGLEELKIVIEGEDEPEDEMDELEEKLKQLNLPEKVHIIVTTRSIDLAVCNHAIGVNGK